MVVALPGPLSAELLDPGPAGVDVVDLHIDVEPDLPVLGLGNALKGQARQLVVPGAQSRPPGPIGLGRERSVEQRTPEGGESARIDAVDGDTAPAIAHGAQCAGPAPP